MAYISQEEKKVIAPEVKKICEKYGVKGSLSIRHNSTLVLTIKSGIIDFFESFNRIAEKTHQRKYPGTPYIPVTDDISINPYWYHEHFDGKAKEFLTEIIPALKGKDWFDDSDIMTDYFHVKHYFDINIGKWDKPYKLVK